MKTKLFFAIALCSVCMASFGLGNNPSSPEMEILMASPKPVTMERNCSTFVSVDNKTSCNVFYKQGESFKVSIVAPEEHIDKIKTTVEEGTLLIEMAENTFIKNVKDVKINIESPSLSSMTISGSGGITAQSAIDSSGKPVSLSVKGSGNIKLKKLECKELSANVGGSGNVDVSELKASTSEIEINGSGSITCNGMKVSQKVTMTINGSGNIAVNGSTDVVNVDIHGSGNVTGRLNCDNVTATIKGSGDVKLSGDIKAHYTSVTGSGRVSIR